MKKCHFCKGEVRQRRVRHLHEWRGKPYIFENVPAEVCTQCGEQYFAPDILKRIDEIVTQRVAADRQEQVPVYSL